MREGQDIIKGAVIARVDARDLENDLATAQAQFDAAKLELVRAEILVKSKTISQSVLDERKTQMDIAAASLSKAQKRVDDAVLYAPFGGVVAVVFAKQFQNIAPQEPVVRLQSAGVMEAVIQVPSNLVANSDQVEPQGTIIVLDASPQISIPATFLTIATEANPAT